MFKILPQTYNQCLNVNVKHGKWFLCEICDVHVKNRYDRKFTIGHWGNHNSNGGHKRLQFLRWRRGKRQVRSWKKRIRNSSILERRATPSRWSLSSRRKVITVAVVPITLCGCSHQWFKRENSYGDLYTAQSKLADVQGNIFWLH